MILTQRLCRVCAVDYDDVLAAARNMTPPGPNLVSLEPNTLTDVLEDIRTVAKAVGVESRAETVCRDLTARIDAVRTNTNRVAHRPRVAFLEWLDPLFGGGHWVPEVIEIAGGLDSLGQKQRPSKRLDWSEVIAYAPEVLIVAPCGFSIERAWEEMPILTSQPGFSELPAAQEGHVFVVNGSDYFSRPGPRLIDGLEMLAALFHTGLSALWASHPDAVRRWP